MNDKELNAKIEELQKEVLSLRNSFASSLRTCAIVYTLLVLFVAGYTTYIYSQIKETVTPESFAHLVVNSIKSKLPGVRTSARNQMGPLAEQLAERSVSGIHALIPDAGQYMRNVLNSASDEVLAKFEKENFPVVEKAVDNALESILKEKDKFKEKGIGNALADKINDSLNKELDKLVVPEFYSCLSDFQNELDTLRLTPNKTLTRKQYSELSFILCWIRLNELSLKNDKESGVLSSVVTFSDQAVKTFSERLNSQKNQ